MHSKQIDKLVYQISRLPGLGQRSARRIVLHLLKDRAKIMLPLADEIRAAAESIMPCKECGNLDNISICGICQDSSRQRNKLCVVETVADLWALERSGVYKGMYHVLGGVLSAVEGVGPDDLHIHNLDSRIEALGIDEVIIATNATVDGQTTAFFITQRIPTRVKISRLAYGLPVGGELDYLDEGTLSAAFAARSLVTIS